MTNEEKAREIANLITSVYGVDIQREIHTYSAALEMAEWKDEQHKQEKQKLIDRAVEVKDVDLEKEINEWLLRGSITDTRYDDYCDDGIIETAKHFFELGLKAKGE